VGFCGQCGSQVDGSLRFCTACGAQRTAGEASPEEPPVVNNLTAVSPTTVSPGKYCQGCGAGLIATSAVCPQCGTPATGGTGIPGAKDKSVAVILAVFLGHWTWLYTFEKDQTKFWVSLGIWILGLVTTLIVIGFLILFGVWLWAVIDVAQKSDSWYKQYPNS
jgi:uncharacterized membrane protein YvbJ